MRLRCRQQHIHMTKYLKNIYDSQMIMDSLLNQDIINEVIKILKWL